MTNKKRSLLGGIVYGYDDIEPCIITGLMLKSNIYLNGKHGIGKTILGQVLGKAIDESGRGFRYYAADKAGLVTIGGLPDMVRSEKVGKLQFMETDQAIWGAKVILVDELPRADKERQNYWLEILESRTYNGLPCKYDMLIATGNDNTYRGNFDMDLALKSRFLFWLTAPTFDQVDSDEVIEMIKLNLGGRASINETATRLAEALVEIREKYEQSMTNHDLVDQISTWIGTYIQFVKNKVNGNSELCQNGEAYIPPREFAVHMMQAILGLKAYFDYMGIPESLRLAGQYTVKYVIETRHAAAGIEFTNICSMAWRQLSGMLIGAIDTPEGKLKYKFASAISAPQKVDFWRSHLADAIHSLQNADLTNMAGDTLQQIRQESMGLIGPFWHIMKADDKTAHLANEISGFMITEIARKLLEGKDVPSGNYGRVWERFKDIHTLNPEHVSEILDTK